MKPVLLASVTVLAVGTLLSSGSASAAQASSTTNWCAWPGTSGGTREYDVILQFTVKDKPGPKSIVKVKSVSVWAPSGDSPAAGDDMDLSVVATNGPGSTDWGRRAASFQVNSTTTKFPKDFKRPFLVPDGEFIVLKARSAVVNGVALTCVVAP